MALPDGLYDLLLTEDLAKALTSLDPSKADVAALQGRAAEYLTNVIARQLSAILHDVSGEDGDKAKRQLELINELLVMLRKRLAESSTIATGGATEVVDLVAPPLRVLRSIQRDKQFPMSPEIGLGVPWLFTAGKGSPSLLQEIRRELASSDQVDNRDRAICYQMPPAQIPAGAIRAPGSCRGCLASKRALGQG